VTVDTYDAIMHRHSVRAFTTAPVDREVLERMLRAAMAAPSAMNAQPWQFYVATGATRERIGAAMAQSTVHLKDYIDVLPPERIEAAERFYASLGGAPVVVALSIPGGDEGMDRTHDLVAAGCAIENLLLAACAEGLGCCHLTVPLWVMDEMRGILSVPDGRELISLVIVGHPEEAPLAPEHSFDHVTYFE
jgi:nitroreductase